ncbi:hypothetical protein JXA70_08705 [candidate division KSB1 bacterium]|nr:hypothetical protein [candidate division KSB1 bacterium]
MAEKLHIELWQHLLAIVPADKKIIFLGYVEFDGFEFGWDVENNLAAKCFVAGEFIVKGGDDVLGEIFGFVVGEESRQERLQISGGWGMADFHVVDRFFHLWIGEKSEEELALSDFVFRCD